MSDWLLEVTDLKQYTCCPRIVFYRYCLPRIRPITYTMEEGIRSHEEEETREERRSLRHYGLTSGERAFHLPLVEYKLSEQKAGSHFILQLAAYALLVEEAWGLPVKRGFLYSIPLRKAEPVAITQHLRRKVVQTVTHIRQIVESEVMPSPPSSLRRCITCEFRRFCNDVI